MVTDFSVDVGILMIRRRDHWNMCAIWKMKPIGYCIVCDGLNKATKKSTNSLVHIIFVNEPNLREKINKN